MTSQEIATAVAAMQANRVWKEEVRRNDNGTYSHAMNAHAEWEDEGPCRTDLRFSKEWAR